MRSKHFVFKYDVGDELRAVAKENLLDRILLWRDTLAITLQMSPEAVLKGSLARRIAFAQVSSITDLAQIGLRVSETSLSELSNIISSSLVELKLLNSMPIRGNDQSMIFGAERSVAPVHQIMNATTIRGKNKPPVWEESFNKFRLGVSIDSIAVLHPKGIQVSTVIGHLLDAYKFGKPVDFSKLVEQSAKHGFGPPGKFEWDALESAAEQEGVNVLDGSSYSAKSLLSRVPEVSQLIILSNSTEEVQQSSAQSDRALISTWYSYVKWWHILKLTQSVVKFAEKEAITL